MKNKANFKSIKSTVTTCSMGTYNDLHPKTQNGTKPNKANLPVAAKRSEDGKPISNTLKPSLFSGKDAFSQKLFFAKRTQFQRVKSVASNCYRKVYDALLQKRNEPKRTQLKPIKANYFMVNLAISAQPTPENKPKPNPIQTQTKPIFSLPIVV